MNKQTVALIALLSGWILTADTAQATTYEEKYTYTKDSVRIDWLNGAKESVTVFAEFTRSKMVQQESGDKPRRPFHRC